MSNQDPGKKSGSGSPKGLKTTEMSFELIEDIKELGSAGPTELAERLDAAKSTVHRHLVTLTELGYIIEKDGEYALSLRFLDLGDRARNQLNLYQVVKVELDELVRELGERSQFMVPENSEGVYIYQTKGERGIDTDSHIGTRVPLHATAVGKAYLSSLPDEEVQTLLQEMTLTAETAHTITDPEQLLGDLKKTRERGYALNEQEKKPGTYAIGVPIQHTETGETIGAVSLTAPETRMFSSSFREEAPERLQSMARVIGLKATY